MSYELEPLQRLLLWRLAVSDEGEFLKEINTSLSSAKRKALVREGFIDEVKRKHPKSGRGATFLTLEDKGWSWCQEHLTDELKTRSTQTTPILERLLRLMADYFQSQQHTNSFGQFVLQAKPSPPAPAESNLEPVDITPTETLEESIRAACLELGNGQRNVRVRLSELRTKMGVANAVLDQKLLEMEQRHELSLFPLDNPQEIGPADREAALRTQAGHERHIVYLSGKA